MRERPVGYPHLRSSQRAEDRQQEAGRYLHQGRYQGEGLCAGQPDGRRTGHAEGLHERAGAGGRADGPSAAPVRGRGASQASQVPSVTGTFRREDYIAPGGTVAGKVPVLPAEGGQAGRGQEEAGRRRALGQNRRKRNARRRPSSWPPCPRRSSRRRSRSPRSRPRRSPTSSSRWMRSAPRRAGSKPLSEHLRKHEEKKAKDEAAAKTGLAAQGGRRRRQGRLPAAGGPAPGRERPRRGARRRRCAEEEKEEAAKTLGGREQRQLKRKRVAGTRRAGRRRRGTADDRGAPPDRAAPTSAAPAPTPPPRARARSSVDAALHGADLLRGPRRARPTPSWQNCLAMGVVSNIAANVDAETAELLAVELGVEVDFRREVSLEDKLLVALEQGPTIRPGCSPGRRSSRSWATSTTARPRCWTASSASTWRRTRRAASRSTSAPTASRRTAGPSPSSIRRATRPSPRCAPAGPTSPTSPCWSWPPTTASCRRPKRPSATPGPPACPSSWR